MRTSLILVVRWYVAQTNRVESTELGGILVECGLRNSADRNEENSDLGQRGEGMSVHLRRRAESQWTRQTRVARLGTVTTLDYNHKPD